MKTETFARPERPALAALQNRRTHRRQRGWFAAVPRRVAAGAEDDVSGLAAVFNSVCGWGVVVCGFAFGFPVERFKRERLLRQLMLHGQPSEQFH